jgi:hypothetical protein
VVLVLNVNMVSWAWHQAAYHLFEFQKIAPFETHLHPCHETAVEYREFPFADIDDTVYHSHTSALLKHTRSKLERLSAFVKAVVSWSLFYHWYGFRHAVSRDHFTSVNTGIKSVKGSFNTYVLPKFFPHLEQENGFSRVSEEGQLQPIRLLSPNATYENGNAG